MEKKKLREREPFLYRKNMHRMEESSKFMVREGEQEEPK